jgi:hypothetical protein
VIPQHSANEFSVFPLFAVFSILYSVFRLAVEGPFVAMLTTSGLRGSFVRAPCCLLLLLFVCVAPRVWAASEKTWRRLEDGLELGIFTAPLPSDTGDSKIRILRIDPARFELKLLNASASADGKPLTPREWARQHGLVAAINASMYQEDYRTSVSLMRTRAHTNNPRLSKDKAVLAFDPLDPGVPPTQIIDRSCQDFESLQSRYGTLVQSIRMVSCGGHNVWKQGSDRWSTAAIAMDAKGRILFIHVRSPYTTHDLIDLLLALPIELRNAMYVEGGPQAQLYVSSGEQEVELAGSHAATFLLGDDTVPALPIPNVVGVARRIDQSDPD